MQVSSWIHRETMREYHRRLQPQSLFERCYLRADFTTGQHHRLLLPLPSSSHRPEMRARYGFLPFKIRPQIYMRLVCPLITLSSKWMKASGKSHIIWSDDACPSDRRSFYQNARGRIIDYSDAFKN